jgi:hypothetical protein
LPLLTKGQVVQITGQVYDQNKQPLVAASVQIINKNNSNLVAFSIANNGGEYKLSFAAQDSLEIRANYLGFRLFSQNLTYDSLIKDQRIDIQLVENTIMMDSFIVKGSTPMLIKGDTIIFDPTFFTDGTETAAEDVLKKLPGVQVNENGSVKVNGKPIETIMIDGDNIVGQQYEMLSKNLSAKLIDKIEILNKFHHNHLYKDIENSEKIAINIRLNKQNNTALFGNVELAFGMGPFYEGRLNLISIYKKFKLYSFSNANNIGEKVDGDELAYVSGKVFNGSNLGDDFFLSKSINLRTIQPELESQRYRFNNTMLENLHLLYTPNKKLKAKLSFLSMGDLVNFFNTNEQISQVPGVESFIENYNTKNKYKNHTGGLSLTWNKSTSETIEFYTSHINGEQKDDAQLAYNSNPFKEQLNTYNKSDDFIFLYTKKMPRNQLLSTNIRYKKQHMPQEYFINNFVDSSLLNLFNLQKMYGLNQQQHLTLNYVGAEFKYLKKSKKYTLEQSIELNDRIQEMSSNLFFTSRDSVFNANSKYINDFKYKISDYCFRSGFHYSLTNTTSLFLKTDLHYMMAAMNPNESLAANSIEGFFPTYNMGVNIKIHKKNNLLLSHSLATSALNAEDVRLNFQLQDYRTISKGLTQYEFINNYTYLANYTFGGWMEGLLFNTNFIFTKSPKYVSSNSYTSNDIIQRDLIFLYDNKRMYIYNFSIDKFLKKLSCNLKINLTYSQNSSSNVVNNTSRRITINNASTGMELRSVFDQKFNFHLGFEWQQNTFISLIGIKNQNLNSFVDTYFKLNKRISIQVKNDLQQIKPYGQALNSYLFTDANLQFTSSKKVTLTFVVNNMLNTKSYQTLSFDDIFTSISSIRLIPRYAMLRLNFGF